MSLARLVITAVVVEGRTKSEVARDYGVSRYWVQTLVKRFQAEGEAAFEPRSRRPHHSPHGVSAELEDRIIRLRKELTKKGLDAGAETIRAHLARGWVGGRPRPSAAIAPPPAVSTIWRILTRRGFVTPQPRKRPKSSYRRFQADLPNERWQADATHWALADRRGRVLREVEIINILDDHSRLDVASDAYPTATGADAVRSFRKGFRRHGIPASVLTDNGAIFTGKPRRGGRVALETELGILGVKAIHSRPYHPQTCGKVERFHQTQKKWLAAQPPAATIADLQRQLDAFRRYYNTVRPHRALGRATPAEANAARPKAAPTGPIIDPHYRVRTDRVDTSGVVTLRHNSRLHHIGLGRARARTRVTMLIDDLHIRVLDADTGELIRDLVLDPNRDYQPTGRPPGRPRKAA
jgi:transposase InsO family protein